MLHLVPALMLLILQGPAGADRSPCCGRLPAVLEALNAKLARTEAPVAIGSKDDQALASLLALGARDPHWSAMIKRMLLTTDFEASLAIVAVQAPKPRASRVADPIVGPPERTACSIGAALPRFRDGPRPR